MFLLKWDSEYKNRRMYVYFFDNVIVRFFEK